MKKISLVLSLALLFIVVFAFNVFAATTNNIENDARFEQNGSKSDLLDLSKVIDNDYNTASSCGNDGENWVNYRFYYDEGTTVSKVFVVLNSTGTLSNGTVYDTVSTNSYEFYVRLYDKYENVVIGTKYHSINNATEFKDAEGNVLYTYFEVVFDEPYSDIYMVEVPVVNNKNPDVGLWEVEIYNYVCGADEHDWVGTLCGEHCDFCGEVKDPTLACEAEEDDGDCRTAILCKYCDSVLVASKKHVFANGETVCSNDGCVFEGKNIVKDTSITPVDVSENSYGENGEFMNWWYYSAHITDGKYDTIAHSNYFGQYKFTFTLKNPTTLSEIFIVSNSSGVYHPWGYGHDNLNKDFAVKVIIYDAVGEVIQTVEYQSLDFTNTNVVPIYAENGEMTSVGYKLDANYANAKKIELFINEGVWEVEIYEHVTCDYQFVETVAPGCTTEGYDLYKCACGNEKYENTVAAVGHNYDEGVVTKEAGEEEDGEILYTCATCGGTKTLAIPATGHEHDYNTYVKNSVEPTCAIVGSATYQCRCGGTIEVEIPATGNHNYNVFVAYTVEPTYLLDGYADYKCATCDGTINVNVGRLQMNTAIYAEVVKELGGWTVCEKYLIDGNYNLGSAGSHTTNGWAFSLNYGEDYYFNKLAFVVNSVGKFPSDGVFNYTSKTTKNYSFAITLYDANGKAVWTKSTTCAEAVEMTGVDANGNEFLYDVVTIELDETVVASKLYVKINSGWDNGAGMWEVETYGLPVNYHTEHDFSILLEKYSDPTCAVDGSALYRCAKCDTTSVKAIPATGHTMSAATCTAPATCSVCGATEGEALGHTMSAATCTTPATCSVCGATEGEALGHTMSAATCTAPATCSVCGVTEGEALGHTMSAATCTAPATCSVCGATEGEALGHTMSAATCTTPATCSVCGATEGEALGHDMSVAATCTTPKSCSRCDYTEGEALGHTWADATCTAPKTCSVCGATEGEALGQHIYDLSNAVTDGNVITIACTNGCGAAATITINGTVAQAGFNMMMQQAVVSVYAPSYGKLTAVASEGSVCLLVTNPRLPAQSFTAPMIVNIDGFNDTYVIVPQFSATDAAPSITITYEELTPATIVEGDNTVDTSMGDTKVQFVVAESGKYNFVLNADAVILTEYGSVATCEGPFEYEAGDVIEIIVMPYGAPSIDITVEKIVEHTHTEEIIPAVLPTPSTQGYTAGIICSDCGETIKAPVAINLTSTITYKDFGIGSTSLAITENISVNYKVNNKLGYSNVYMVFVFENGEYIVTENYYEASSNRYVYNFAETRPHLMNSLITAYVYGEASEGEYVFDVYEYSVAKYCINQLKNSTSNALKTAISDLVVYGAYTQRYMGLSTELVTTTVQNQGCVLTPSTFTGIAQSATAVYNDVDATDDLTWKSSTVAMGSSTEVLFKFAATDISNLQIKIEVGGVEKEIIDASELKLVGNRYEVHVSCITSLEYSETVTATFIKNGVESDSVSDSINNYLGRKVGSYADGNATGDLMKAIYLFGESVTKYFETL